MKSINIKPRNENNICIVNNNKCSLGENELILDEKQNLSVINSHIKNYISEFSYTEKHISQVAIT